MNSFHDEDPFTNKIYQILIYLCPLFPLDLVEEELVVDEGLLAVVELSTEHDKLAVLCNFHCTLKVY